MLLRCPFGCSHNIGAWLAGEQHHYILVSNPVILPGLPWHPLSPSSFLAVTLPFKDKQLSLPGAPWSGGQQRLGSPQESPHSDVVV